MTGILLLFLVLAVMAAALAQKAAREHGAVGPWFWARYVAIMSMLPACGSLVLAIALAWPSWAVNASAAGVLLSCILCSAVRLTSDWWSSPRTVGASMWQRAHDAWIMPRTAHLNGDARSRHH